MTRYNGEPLRACCGNLHSSKGAYVIQPLLKHAAIFSLLAPISANAQYVSNYARWKELPPLMQEAYIIGVLDGWTRTSAAGEPAWMKPERTGVNKCLREQEISSTMLVQLVNSHYETYSADWRLPPAPVAKDVVVGTCLADINSEREKAGLPPWERKPGQISRDD